MNGVSSSIPVSGSRPVCCCSWDCSEAIWRQAASSRCCRSSFSLVPLMGQESAQMGVHLCEGLVFSTRVVLLLSAIWAVGLHVRDRRQCLVRDARRLFDRGSTSANPVLDRHNV